MATPAKKAAKPAAVAAAAEPTPASDATQAMQAELAALRAQLAAAQAEATLAKVQTQAPARGHVQGAGEYVGIRNISNYAIDLPPSPLATEPGVDLVPDTEVPDPRQVAIISYAWWLQLRNSHLVARGMIQRDDSVLGANHTPAPADDPADLPREAAINAIPDVAQFFAAHGEHELAARIEAITSEPTIRRLQFAIDQELARLQAAIPYDSTNPGRRAEQALKALSGKLVKADTALTDRYMQLTEKRRGA